MARGKGKHAANAQISSLTRKHTHQLLRVKANLAHVHVDRLAQVAPGCVHHIDVIHLAGCMKKKTIIKTDHENRHSFDELSLPLSTPHLLIVEVAAANIAASTTTQISHKIHYTLSHITPHVAHIFCLTLNAVGLDELDAVCDQRLRNRVNGHALAR